jgi:hypothetical protein
LGGGEDKNFVMLLDCLVMVLRINLWGWKFCHIVGLSCDGFEDQLMALFTSIEADQPQSGVGSVIDLREKSGNKGNHELKRFVCSVNYDVEEVNLIEWQARGGVANVLYET